MKTSSAKAASPHYCTKFTIVRVYAQVPEDLVQLLDHVLLLVGVTHVEVEHLAERLRIFENRREQKV